MKKVLYFIRKLLSFRNFNSGQTMKNIKYYFGKIFMEYPKATVAICRFLISDNLTESTALKRWITTKEKAEVVDAGVSSN